MEKSAAHLSTFLSSTGLHEYALVAKPDTSVNLKIQQEKQAFYQLYGEKLFTESSSHITVASFVARDDMEDVIIRYIQRICIRQKGFKVALNNFSGFPPHTIYLRVQDEQPFKRLIAELEAVSNYIRSYSYPPIKAVKRFHVSIAGKLTDDIYRKALMDYGQKTFHESFMVNEVALLRRSDTNDSCKAIQIFGLQPAEKNI